MTKEIWTKLSAFTLGGFGFEALLVDSFDFVGRLPKPKYPAELNENLWI